MPREWAISSPSPKIFSDLADRREHKNAKRMQVPGSSRLFMVSPDREPIIKEVRLMVMSVSRSFMVLMPAFKKLDMVMPASIIVVRELSARYASKKTKREVANAPVKAKRGRVKEFAGKNIMASITAKPEPELTPMVLGLARELFMTPCKITPAQAKPMPASSPPITRGRRTVVINR